MVRPPHHADGSSDAELMLCVQDGDRAAFTLLHDRLAARALHVARGACADAEQARDAVQEAFLSAWRGRASYRPERGPVDAWLFGIVRNRAIDAWRHDERHARRRVVSEDRDDLCAPGDVSLDAVATDDARRLRQMVGGLPAPQREVLALAYFGELSHAEIAVELRLPLGTVKSRTRLGLSTLRGHLAAAG